MGSNLSLNSSHNVSARRLTLFLLVGGFATGLHYLLILIFTLGLGWPLLQASGVGFLLSALVNYGLNARLTFQSRESHFTTLPRFAVTAGAGLAINHRTYATSTIRTAGLRSSALR